MVVNAFSTGSKSSLDIEKWIVSQHFEPDFSKE